MKLGIGLGVGSSLFGTAPSLVSLSRSIGDTAGGIALTLTGTGLDGVSSVLIGVTPCTSVVVVNSTTVTCVTPAKSIGTYDVTVVDSSGSSKLTAAYDSWDFVAAGAIVDWAADSGITVTGAGVSAWIDKAATHFSATQGTDAARPPAGNDGKAYVLFNGTSQRLILPSINTTSNWTVFMRKTVASKTTFAGPISLSGQAVPGPMISSHTSTGALYVAWLIHWNGTAEVNSPFDSGTIAIPAAEGNWMYKSDGGYRYAGAARTTGGADSGLSHGNFLGWAHGFFGMKLREVAIFPSLVSAATVTLAERYLTAKWT